MEGDYEIFSYHSTLRPCGTANQPKLCNKQVGCGAGTRCPAQERAWPDYSMM